MDSHWGTPSHRKRKRRRGLDRPPLHAQLVVDARLKGDFGVLSEDLFIELFPTLAAQQDAESNSAGSDSKPCHIAIAPILTSSFIQPDAIPWTIVAVKKPALASSGKQPTRSMLQLPQASYGLQAFLHALQKVSPNRNAHAAVDIQVLDVAPLPLDTVVIGLDHSALLNLENINREFKERQVPARRGSLKTVTDSANSNSSGLNVAGETASLDSRWDDFVRKALQLPRIIHTGDQLPLPVEAHPITHVSPPPALVELCEPVAQGFLLPSTKIVIVPTTGRAKRTQTLLKSPISPLQNGLSEEEEDTSNETFYSAAEERAVSSPAPTKPPVAMAPRHEAEDIDSSHDEETDLSESEEDTIGLSLPTLPTQSSGVLSTFSSATPRPGHLFHNGTASPGSVISTFSTSTVRGGMSKGRLFETHALVSHIPDQALHPRPSLEEDDEARVFVDTTSLVRIGCFSGDWVKVEAAATQSLNNLGIWDLNAFNGTGDDEGDWRVAKVYALPGRSERRPRYAIDRTGHRRFSQSLSHLEKAPLKVHLSPIFLANLGNPTNLRVAPLGPPQSRSQGPMSSKNKITSSSLPPFAKEVTLLRYLTPLATERNLHSSLFMGLRKFFESKRRIVRDGDLIGIPIDEDLGRAAAPGSTGEEDHEAEELFSAAEFYVNPSNWRAKTNVAWFKVGPVIPDAASKEPDIEEENPWGDVAVVQPGSTRMVQTGSEQGRLPESIHSPWQYYLGVRQPPAATGGDLDVPDQVAQPPKPFVNQIRRRLRELIAAATSPQAIYFALPPVAILLISTQRHIGKTTAASNACADLGLHTFTIDSYDILTEGGSGGGDVKTQGFLKARAERGLTCGPEFTALLIKHIDVLNADSVVKTLQEILDQSRILIATTSDVEKIPEAARGLFTHELEISAPDEGEREGLLRDIIQSSGVSVSAGVELSSVAVKTAALVAGDLVDVVERASIAQQGRLEALASSCNEHIAPDALTVTVRDIHLSGGDASRCIVKQDFDVAVDAARKNFADAIGAPKIPNVSWDDVGGLTNVKEAVMETIQLPLERPELFAKGMKKRSGILFYGPPGTGKTLLAKAIATEFSLNFFSVKGPELLNMYIGESEANVRRVFQRARDARPCVVFFDELDSVAPKRGNQGDSGGVMDRIVSQLLAELDGMSNGDVGGGGVFVIGATNRPDLLDQALLRPGRFDKMLYLGVSDTHEKQLKILEALTRKFCLSPALNLADVANKLPFTYTGADLYALCSDAMLKAITRRASAVDAKVRAINAKREEEAVPAANKVTVAQFFDHYAELEDTEVVVEASDFEASTRELVPSVSVKELEHYERVKRVFEQGEEDQKNALVDRPKMREFPLSNGSVKSSGRHNHNEDDYVLRTADLGLTDSESDSMVNSTAGVTVAAVSKGKGRQTVSYGDGGFGEATDGDEELYSP